MTVRTSQLESKHCPTFPVRFDAIETFGAIARPSSDFLEEREGGGDEDSQGGPSAGASSSPFSSRDRRPEEVLDHINARGARSAEYSHVESLGDATTDEGLARLRSASVEDATPWFADARDAILQCRTVSRHETFGHPAAGKRERAGVGDSYFAFPLIHFLPTARFPVPCLRRTPSPPPVLLAVSTRSPDPLNAFSSLFSGTQPQNCDLFQHSPFIDPNVLRYYVLLHDESQNADLEESKSLLESVKKIYGLNCCILPVNGGDEEDETKRYSAFVRELVAQGLVPWMERCVSQWNESIAASRKGLTGRLFGAGRKFFASSAPLSRSASTSGSGTATPDRPTYNPQGAFYPHAALEAQTRRLGDFAFMTRDYKLAAATYDVGRKDYGNDKAFQYAAGATEMFGLSHLMMMMGAASPPIDVDSYLASACAMYRMTSGPSALLRPVKATLLYYEAYRALNFYRPAPLGLVRAAQDPVADLEVMAAMLLEQAAFADLHSDPAPSLRKYALHLTMAAHKYRQCGAKQLSLRCFRGAKQAYVDRGDHVKQFERGEGEGGDEDGEGEGLTPSTIPSPPLSSPGFSLIQDHVELELGRQAFNDGRCEEAVEHFLQLLRPSGGVGGVGGVGGEDDGESLLAPLHQVYVRELLAAYASLSERAASGYEPVWAMFRAEQSWLGGKGDSAQDSAATSDAAAALNELEQRLRPRQRQASPAAAITTVAVGEEFTLHLHVVNPLAIDVDLTDIKIEVSGGEENVQDAQTTSASASAPAVKLSPREARTLAIPLSLTTSNKGAAFRIAAVSYTFAGSIPFTQRLTKRGRRLNATREQRTSAVPQYAPDETLLVVAADPQPALSVVAVENVPDRIGLGEEREVRVVLQNVGKADMARGLVFLTDRPEAVSLRGGGGGDAADPPPGPLLSLSNDVASHDVVTPLPASKLSAGATYTATLTVRGSVLGHLSTHLLFASDDADGGDGDGNDSSAAYSALRAHCTISLEVYPVVDIAVDISPAASGFAYDLAISALNLHPGGEVVRIKSALVVSPRWRWKRRSPPTSPSPSPMRSAFSALPPMQPCRAVVGVEEAAGAAAGEAVSVTAMMSHTAEQLRTLLIGRDIDRSARPGKVDLQLSADQDDDGGDDINAASPSPSPSRFLHASRSQWRRTQLAQQFPTMSPSDRDRIFTLWAPEDLDVLVNWETADGIARGQVFIFGLSLGPACNRIDTVLASTAGGGRSLYEATVKEKAALVENLSRSHLAAEEDPLVVDIEGGGNDGGGGSDTLVVVFRVRNMSTTRAARCVLDLDSTIESEVAAAASSASARKASWLGRLTLRSGVIPPRGSVELKATAARPDAATTEAELGDWSIKADVLAGGGDESAAVLQSFSSGRLRSGKVVRFG